MRCVFHICVRREYRGGGVHNEVASRSVTIICVLCICVFVYLCIWFLCICVFVYLCIWYLCIVYLCIWYLCICVFGTEEEKFIMKWPPGRLRLLACLCICVFVYLCIQYLCIVYLCIWYRGGGVHNEVASRSVTIICVLCICVFVYFCIWFLCISVFGICVFVYLCYVLCAM